jgi:hypothetical protein
VIACAGLLFFACTACVYIYRKYQFKWHLVLRDLFQDIHSLSLDDSKWLLMGCWVSFPVILPFIYSRLFTPIYLERYTICAAPALILLIAAGISRLKRMIPTYVPIVALLIVMLPGLQDYYVTDLNEQWREAAAFVQENVKADDIVIFAPEEEGFHQINFDWYYHGYLPGCGITAQDSGNQGIADALSSCIVGHERFWVVIRGAPEVINRMKSFFLNSNQTVMQLINERQFVQISVYLFELKK